MGIEGGGQFENLGVRQSEEVSQEINVEASGSENYWLAEMGVTPETLERIKGYRIHEGSSAESLIYMLLIGKLVEGGAGMDPQTRTRLRNLVGIFRVLGFSNMTEQEQASIIGWSKATTFNAKNLEYDLNPDVIADVNWIWKEFGLLLPMGGVGELTTRFHNLLKNQG